jgi:hypothetical protein
VIWSDLHSDMQLHVKVRNMSNEHVRTKCDFKDLRGLVRAGGSSGSIDAIQIVGRLSRIHPGKTHGVVYDFVDSYHPSSYRKSNERKKHYVKQQWDVKEYPLSPGA